MLGWRVIPRIGFLSPHGIGIALGYFVGSVVLARRARKRGFDEEHAWNAALWGMVGAIVGARVAYVAGHADQFPNFIEIFQVWKGGISLVGGLIGGIGAGYLYVRWKRLSFLELMDLAAPGLGIGIVFGRIGDLMIGDHLGRQTNGFWGWRYEGGELISPPPCRTPDGAPVYSSPSGCIEPGIVVHQTALYDMFWSLIIFGVLLYLGRRPRPRGFMFFTWGFLYSIGRVVTDFLRVDKTWLGLGLTGSQLTSILFLVFTIVMLMRSRTESVAREEETATAVSPPPSLFYDPPTPPEDGPEPIVVKPDDEEEP